MLTCSTATDMSDAALMTLVRTIVTADDTVALGLLAANPALAKARFQIGATRQTAHPDTCWLILNPTN